MIEEDYDNLTDFIIKNNAVIFRKYNKTKSANAVNSLNEEGISKEWMYCVVPVDKVSQVKFIERNLTDGFYYEIDVDRSPVIEIIKSVCIDNYLQRGRVYFKTKFYDSDNSLVKKDAETIALGNLLISFIKKNFVKLEGEYKSCYTSRNVINNNYNLALN